MPVWMIVEDEREIHEVMLDMFEVWGINGLSFTDAPEAIDWLNSVDEGCIERELPQLALIDIRLPTLSGIEVAQRIRQSCVLGEIAIALMTAYYLSSQEEAEAMELTQANLLLYKPLLNMHELRQVLNDLLN